MESGETFLMFLWNRKWRNLYVKTVIDIIGMKCPTQMVKRKKIGQVQTIPEGLSNITSNFFILLLIFRISQIKLFLAAFKYKHSFSVNVTVCTLSHFKFLLLTVTTQWHVYFRSLVIPIVLRTLLIHLFKMLLR